MASQKGPSHFKNHLPVTCGKEDCKEIIAVLFH